MEDVKTREKGPVEQLLSGPEHWIQGTYAALANGVSTTTTDKHATRFCLLGALRHCYPSTADASSAAWDRLASRFNGQLYDSIRWNDASERTFADVHALIQELNL